MATDNSNQKKRLRRAVWRRYEIERKPTSGNLPFVAKPVDFIVALVEECTVEERTELAASFALNLEHLDELIKLESADDENQTIKASDQLAELIQGPYSTVWTGEGNNCEALRQLLASEEHCLQLQKLLKDYRASNSALEEDSNQHLFYALQEGFRLARLHYCRSAETNLSNYVLSSSKAAFRKALEPYILERETSFLELYNRPKEKNGGWYQPMLREYGPCAANLLLVLSINEVIPFTECSQWLSIRDAAMILCPENYIVRIPDYCSAAEQCVSNELVELVPILPNDDIYATRPTASIRIRPVKQLYV